MRRRPGDAAHQALLRRIAVSMVVALAPARVRPRLRESQKTLPLDAESDSEAPYEYLALVLQAWFVLAIAFGLLMGLLAYLGDRLAGTRGQHVGIGIGFGRGFFAIAGGVYATALRLYAWPCVSRYKRSRVVDEGCRRVLARARLSDASLVVQAVVGVAVGFWAAARF